MPNGARSEMIVSGELKILQKFFGDIKRSISQPERLKTSFGREGLGYIFIDGLNLDPKKDIEPQFSKYDITPRGGVEEVDSYFDCKVPCVVMTYQSAGDSRIDDFNLLLSKKYPGLSAVTRCVEPDMEIYYHNDPTGYGFSKDSYYVDISYRNDNQDSDGYDIGGSNLSKDELIGCCSREFGREFSSIKEIKKFVNTGNDDSYCTIIPISIYN